MCTHRGDLVYYATHGTGRKFRSSGMLVQLPAKTHETVDDIIFTGRLDCAMFMRSGSYVVTLIACTFFLIPSRVPVHVHTF